jgi:acyl carrier protein
MNIYSKVRDILHEQLGVDPAACTNEAKLMEDLGADSFDMAELIMECESEFGIDIPDSEIPNLNTILDLISFIHSAIP